MCAKIEKIMLFTWKEKKNILNYLYTFEQKEVNTFSNSNP